jgi:hypothetical protein
MTDDLFEIFIVKEPFDPSAKFEEWISLKINYNIDKKILKINIAIFTSCIIDQSNAITTVISQKG